MFRILFLWSLAVMPFLFAAPDTHAQEFGPVKLLEHLVGEDYRYAIDFLFFTELAAGELRFEKTDQQNVYRAELIGRTLGIASWLTGERTQTYTSLMELTSDGSLRSIEHAAKTVKRRWGKWQNRERRHHYDYVARKVFEEKTKEGLLSSKTVDEIPDGQQPVDVLTAFYNLRIGAYGPLIRGTKLMIPTYAKGEFTQIEVDILTLEQQAEHKYFTTHGLLLLAKVDPEIFETESGQLFVWFNEAGVPERGIVEDVIGLGDARGRLQEEE